MYLTSKEDYTSTSSTRTFTYTIDVGGTLSGQKVWLYIARTYLDTTTSTTNYYFKNLTADSGEIAPFQKVTSVGLSNKSRDDNYYGKCRVYIVVTTKLYTDYNQMINEIPLKFWYQILRFQYAYSNNRVILPERAYYEPGDIIRVVERTECTSSSSSCHHGNTIVWCIDGNAGTTTVRHDYSNHDSSIYADIQIPTDDNPHSIWWRAYSDDNSNGPDAGSVDVNTLTNRFWNNKQYAAISSDYVDPVGGITNFHVKSGGSWKPSKAVYVKSGGVWKEGKEAYVKSGGVWKKV